MNKPTDRERELREDVKKLKNKPTFDEETRMTIYKLIGLLEETREVLRKERNNGGK